MEMEEETWRGQAKEMFSPKITNRGKDVKRKEVFVFSPGNGLNEEN